jgi:hypothetical protein
VKIYSEAVKTKVAGYLHVVSREAVELLRRRKFSYTILALTLTTGWLYMNGVVPALVTSAGQANGAPNNSSSADPGQNQPLQAVTGQDGTQPNESIPASGGSSQQQSSTSVTVNGNDIPVPANGEVHKTVTNDGGTTSISVSHDSTADNSSSSLNVQISSQGTASQEGN